MDSNNPTDVLNEDWTKTIWDVRGPDGELIVDVEGLMWFLRVREENADPALERWLERPSARFAPPELVRSVVLFLGDVDLTDKHLPGEHDQQTHAGAGAGKKPATKKPASKKAKKGKKAAKKKSAKKYVTIPYEVPTTGMCEQFSVTQDEWDVMTYSDKKFMVDPSTKDLTKLPHNLGASGVSQQDWQKWGSDTKKHEVALEIVQHANLQSKALSKVEAEAQFNAQTKTVSGQLKAEMAAQASAGNGIDLGPPRMEAVPLDPVQAKGVITPDAKVSAAKLMSGTQESEDFLLTDRHGVRRSESEREVAAKVEVATFIATDIGEEHTDSVMAIVTGSASYGRMTVTHFKDEGMAGVEDVTSVEKFVGDPYAEFKFSNGELYEVNTHDERPRTEIYSAGIFLPGDHPDLPMELRKSAAAAIVKTWANTSNNHNPLSLAVQEVARKEFGLGETAEWRADAPTELAAQEVITAHGPYIAAALRSQYHRTQQDFKDKGITHVEVHRGVGGKKPDTGLHESYSWQEGERLKPDTGLHNPEAWKGEGETLEYTPRPLSSWSFDIDTTEDFGRHRMTTRVPVTRCLSTPRTGLGCLNEYEVVVLGKPGDKATFVSPPPYKPRGKKGKKATTKAAYKKAKKKQTSKAPNVAKAKKTKKVKKAGKWSTITEYGPAGDVGGE